MAVVSARKGGIDEKERAKRYAYCLGLSYVDRCGRSLAELSDQMMYEAWLVVEKDGFYVAADGIRDRFHINMAALRWKEWKTYGRDHLSRIASEIRPKCILDATYGIGSDSLMLAATTGANVVALEASLPLYIVGKLGLALSSDKQLPLSASRRIHLWHTDVLSYLREQKSMSFDLIYFDFMFTHSVKDSSNLNPLRRWGIQEGMTKEIWSEACRVCRGSIVRKERPFGRWLREHPPDVIRGGRYSKVCYGVWSCA